MNKINKLWIINEMYQCINRNARPNNNQLLLLMTAFLFSPSILKKAVELFASQALFQLTMIQTFCSLVFLIKFF